MFGVIHKHLVRVRTNRWVVMCEASVSFSDKELTRKYKRLHALCVDEMELETLLALAEQVYTYPNGWRLCYVN